MPTSIEFGCCDGLSLAALDHSTVKSADIRYAPISASCGIKVVYVVKQLISWSAWIMKATQQRETWDLQMRTTNKDGHSHSAKSAATPLHCHLLTWLRMTQEHWRWFVETQTTEASFFGCCFSSWQVHGEGPLCHYAHVMSELADPFSIRPWNTATLHPSGFGRISSHSRSWSLDNFWIFGI